MSEYINKSQYEQKEIKRLMNSADKYFNRIEPDIKNGNILIQTIETEGISASIVNRLEDIEKRGDSFWNNKELNDWYKDQINLGNIKAPEDPVDKMRWLSLMCITASIKEGFSCGNVVIPPDVLPEDSKEFKMYEELYGSSVLEDIITFRNTLKK